VGLYELDFPSHFVIRPGTTVRGCFLSVFRWLNISVAMSQAFQEIRLLKDTVFSPCNGHGAASDGGIEVFLDL